MRYISTRGNAPAASFSEVLLAGLAPDGGLYVPETYPQFTWEDVLSMRGWSYHSIAVRVLELFVGDDIPFEDLSAIVEKTYSPRLFGSYEIVPIVPIEPSVALLKLSEGPTFAFKDLALQLVANLMEYVLEKHGEKITILGATSGDTGSAAAYAVLGKKRQRLFMLSPYGRMSLFQQKQMYTINEKNICNIVADGNFDDCQAAVKLVNQDAEFKKRYSIGAMNSINWARIVAQTIYWVYGFVRMVRREEDFLTAAVPSGNFGNALSAYVAARMGLNIHVIVCTNENDVLDQFFKTGEYRIREGGEVKKTSSPSMDIASASNLERFVFDYLGRDPKRIVDLWGKLKADGVFKISDHDLRNPLMMVSGSASEKEVLKVIKDMFNWYGVIVDPHTAVAVRVGYGKYVGPGLGPMLIAETAKPIKFVDTIRNATGVEIWGSPGRIREMFNAPEKIVRVGETDPTKIAEKVKEIISSANT
jgi:threonine synthase